MTADPKLKPPHGGPLRIAVLAGSVRDGNNSLKTARVIATELEAAGVKVDLIDPRMLDLGVPGLEGRAHLEESLGEILRARVATSDGIVVVTPEYDGSYSAITKIMIEALGYPSALAGKPVTAVGVASGRIGAVRALEHLSGLLFNAGALVLPKSPSLAAVHKCFDEGGRLIDERLLAELRAAVGELVDFAARLR